MSNKVLKLTQYVCLSQGEFLSQEEGDCENCARAGRKVGNEGLGGDLGTTSWGAI